jgi:hypothetical protein
VRAHVSYCPSNDLGIKVPNDAVDCPDCPEGEAKHASHPSRGVVAQEPGHAHVDLSGITNEASLEGFRYYMLCSDEFTNFNMVYLCKTKADVPLLISQLIVDFENITKRPILSFSSNNGSEFCNKTVELLLFKENIHHVTSAPYCPQQNGRIEREMQSVTNMARIMLLASRLPKKSWSEAIKTAVYLKNQLPNSN